MGAGEWPAGAEASQRRNSIGGGGAAPPPPLEECKTDSDKTDKTEGGRSDTARSAAPTRPPALPQSHHARSLSGTSSIAGGHAGPLQGLRLFPLPPSHLLHERRHRTRTKRCIREHVHVCMLHTHTRTRASVLTFLCGGDRGVSAFPAVPALGGWGWLGLNFEESRKSSNVTCAGLDLYPSGTLPGHLASSHHSHRRSVTNLSELGAEKSPESASRFRPPPESLEAQLSHKLQVRALLGCTHT